MNQAIAHNIIEAGSTEWHAERRKGIGGSDAAAAVGESRWKTPLQLYLEKTGEAQNEEESWEMARGKAIEPLLRQHYADKHKVEVRLPVKAMIHPKYEFLRYNPDGLVDGRLIEFKTAAYGKGWGEDGTDEIPKEYTLQVQHGMMVTGLPVTDVTVSIAGNAPRYFIIEADRELQEMLLEREAEFWQRVVDMNPPAPITNKDANEFHRKVNGLYTIADDVVSLSVVALKQLKDEIKSHEELKENLEVQIKNFMGENETLVDADGVPLVTWKQQNGSKRINGNKLRDKYPIVAADVTEIGDPMRRLLVK